MFSVPKGTKESQTMLGLKYLQVNLGRGREAQDLLMQTAVERKVDVLLISEQYRKPELGCWFQDVSGRAAISVLNRELRVKEVGEQASNFVWIDVGGMRIYSCYFSPNDQNEEFARQLDELEESLRMARCELLIAGDFNCKSPEWGSRRLDARGALLSEMIARLDLVILNEGNDFTFRRGDTGSVIDITLSTGGVAAGASAWRVLEEITLSDHQYIEFHTRLQRNSNRSTFQDQAVGRGGWLLRKLDIERLRAFLIRAKQQEDLQRITELQDPEMLVEFMMRTITAACDDSMPKRKTRTRGRAPVYWWTPEIAALRQQCLGARRAMQRARRNNEDAALHEAFKDARKKLRDAIKHSKRRCWSELCREIDEDPWGLPFKIVTKKLASGHQIPGLSCPERMSRIVEELFPKHERRPERATPDGNIPEESFNIEELKEAAKRLKKGKAPGPDNIPNEIIVQVIEVWPELLLETYNACLRKGMFPRRWKRQRLVLLRKGNKPLDQPSSYRPLSLLDTVGKLFERLLLQRLEAHIKENGGLSPRQYGFQRGRSTVDAIMNVVNVAKTVTTGYWKSKGYCALVTLDIRNAFNTARWDRTMEALAERRTPDYLLDMIDSYLADRMLIYDTEIGPKEYEITAGVPQGSVLGPFLWNVMYDGLLNLELPVDSRIVGFADDAAVVVTASTTDTLEVLTNETIRRASMWLNANGLDMAVHKTEAVLITDKRAFTPPELILEEEIVPWSRSVRYLGVQIDGGLRYADHVTTIAEKAATTATALARLMPNIGGPSECKRRLLNSVVHSKILYGAEVWANAMESTAIRRNLAAVQRRSVIRVISAFRTVSEGAALVLASTPPIDLLIREKQEIYEEWDEDRSVIRKAHIKKTARRRLMERWQERWDADTKGRWTHRLIPNVSEWCERAHGQMNYHLTQALTGHGCFMAYLERFKIRESAACLLCGHINDDSQHAIFDCAGTENERSQLRETLGADMCEERLVPAMLENENAWTAVSAYIRHIMAVKRLAEQAEKANEARGGQP